MKWTDVYAGNILYDTIIVTYEAENESKPLHITKVGYYKDKDKHSEDYSVIEDYWLYHGYTFYHRIDKYVNGRIDDYWETDYIPVSWNNSKLFRFDTQEKIIEFLNMLEPKDERLKILKKKREESKARLREDGKTNNV